MGRMGKKGRILTFSPQISSHLRSHRLKIVQIEEYEGEKRRTFFARRGGKKRIQFEMKEWE